jgi:hypothetical protein
VAKARALYRQLERHPEVRQALVWAAGQEQKRQAEAKRRAVAIRSIKGKIEHLRQSRHVADLPTSLGGALTKLLDWRLPKQ